LNRRTKKKKKRLKNTTGFNQLIQSFLDFQRCEPYKGQ
jgi:hypothetical protein